MVLFLSNNTRKEKTFIMLIMVFFVLGKRNLLQDLASLRITQE